jgi:hypothetical protein
VKSSSRKKTLTAGVLLGAALLASAAVGISVAAAHSKAPVKCPKPVGRSWSFGVMDDTQWTVGSDPAGANPNDVPVSIIKQINAQMIDKHVKFVIQVGDLTENGNNADLDVRAAAAQKLLDASIGYFPMRGNHETYASPANDYAIPEFQKDFPQTRGLADTFGASNFSSPTSVSSDLNGMSYSFDYGRPGSNARFVIVDPWATPSKNGDPGDGYNYGYSIADQQNWISSRLDKNTRGTTQAFVFSHQPMIAENHQDSPFTGYTNANPATQNAFIASLQNNDVKYYVSGHDHMMQRSIIASPDGKSSVQEIIGASNSSKFYTPKALTDAKWYGQKARETSVTQDLYTVGYYVYTVSGPSVTVDYYADDHGNWKSDASFPNGTGLFDTGVTPAFHFVKKATWGYSLNGKQFVVGGGATNGTNNSPSYTVVKDSFQGTTARILSGSYADTATDYNGRVLAQTVDTGWTRDTARDELTSNILTLWGLTNGGLTNAAPSTQTDIYALSMSYDAPKGRGWRLDHAGILATSAGRGRWVNAVDGNTGGTDRFVLGPWKASYGLGTYGVDVASHTAWAVVNHGGRFAVSRDFRGLMGHRH